MKVIPTRAFTRYLVKKMADAVCGTAVSGNKENYWFKILCEYMNFLESQSESIIDLCRGDKYYCYDCDESTEFIKAIFDRYE